MKGEGRIRIEDLLNRILSEAGEAVESKTPAAAPPGECSSSSTSDI